MTSAFELNLNLWANKLSAIYNVIRAISPIQHSITTTQYKPYAGHYPEGGNQNHTGFGLGPK